MKTRSILFKVFTIMLATSTLCVSCKSKTQNHESAEKPEIKAKAPNVDIHTAAFIGDVKSIKQHIAAGTNINQKDQYGSTPVIISATFGKTEAAIALIEGGADLTITNGEGSTPLHVAAFFCREEIVKALLAKGADKTLKNNYGSTALESISAPFKDVKPIYEQIAKQLGALGLKLNFERIEKTRPVIAEMLK